MYSFRFRYLKLRWFFFRTFDEKMTYTLVMAVTCVCITMMFVRRSYKEAVEEKRTVTQRWVQYYADQGVAMPNVVFAQNILETGFFTSKLSRPPIIENGVVLRHGSNNHFGMKRNSRPFGVSPRGGPVPPWCGDSIHACYSSPLDGAADYAQWQRERLRAYCRYFGVSTPSTVEEYFHFLNNLVLYNREGKPYLARYAEDPDYTEKLRHLINLTIPNKLGGW